MKLLGGILLIVGTAIGGGMLALPIATSEMGFIYSTLLLFFCWFVMTMSAFLLLEVNLWLPTNSNIISMSKATLGRSGEIVAWISYILLLYSLLAAYIAGGGDFLNHMLQSIQLKSPVWLSTSLFTLLFGYIVYHGIQSVDMVNRGLMFLKLTAFILLVVSISPHISFPQLKQGQLNSLTASVTVAMTSFGYATIIPSLRTYFHDDIKKLRFAILIGSLIPLVCYIIWDMVIMGVIPREGDHGLIMMMQTGKSTSEFVGQLSAILNQNTITTFARIFSSVCLLTSFLGVALCLSDFLADGFRVIKNTRNKILVNIATFFPPLLIVLFYPGAFITALSYAGIFALILLVFLPALMAWHGRYNKQYSHVYHVAGGKVMLGFLITIAVGIIVKSIINLV